MDNFFKKSVWPKGVAVVAGPFWALLAGLVVYGLVSLSVPSDRLPVDSTLSEAPTDRLVSALSPLLGAGVGLASSSSLSQSAFGQPFSASGQISPSQGAPLQVSIVQEARPSSDIRHPSIRGVTLSTHRGGQEWASDEMPDTLADIQGVGANWIAIHPYARISEDGTVEFRNFDSDSPPEYLMRPIRDAHRLGLKILIKPHLAYWGSPFSWRGEIEFEHEEQWERFFSTYERWIVGLARASAGADAFAVGTELDKTLHREQEWALVIEKIKAVSSSPLTYAANWTDYRRVPFWEEMDAIGIQAYFPVSDSENPTTAELEASWDRLLQELAAFSRKNDRHIVFTEIGYNQSPSAASEPWKADLEIRSGSSGELQRRCLRVALQKIEAEERVLGSFLWKWFPRPRSVGRDFQLAYPEMMDLLREEWPKPAPAKLMSPQDL